MITTQTATTPTTTKQGNRRDEILVKGNYAAIPKAALADKRLSPRDKIVLMAHIEHLGQNTTTWTGPSAMAKETGLSRRGVQLANERLEATGWIRAIHHAKPGANTHDTNIYIVNKQPDPSATVALAHPCATPSAPVRYPLA